MEIDNRKEQIIKAAIHRFSHFGVTKTTMNEIAEDSSISKGNIYYYFTDKNSLIAEVVQALLIQFEEVVNAKLVGCSSTLESLEQIQKVKIDFFEKYFMLNLFEGFDCTTGHENVKNIAEATNIFGMKIISKVLEKGVKSGELRIPNIHETAELYIQANRGIYLANQVFSTKRITIDHDLMKNIHDKQLSLAKIFIQAYSINTNKNEL